jgi:hypothetical protein
MGLLSAGAGLLANNFGNRAPRRPLTSEQVDAFGMMENPWANF